MKKLWMKIYIPLSLMYMTIPMRTFAVDAGGGGKQSGAINATLDENGNLQDKEGIAKQLENIFTSEGFGIGDNEINAGQKLAQPIIELINTFTIALYLIVVYIFFGQTAVDLFYIFCPIARGMMEKRAENKGFGGDSRSGGNFCISESAYEAVNGSGSGGGMGMGGGSERSYGTAILKYCGTRIGELAIFIFFSILFLGGFIGQIIMMFFYLLSPVIETLINFGK